MKQVPGDVFHHGSVTREDRLCLDYLPLLRHGTYVPQTDCLWIRKEEIKTQDAIVEHGQIKSDMSLTWSSDALRREPDRFGFQERP